MGSTDDFICDFLRFWNAAGQSVGLNDLRVHDLRHSFASALVNAGGTLYDAQRLLGHSSSRMTERYAHLTLSRLTNAASDMSNHFNLGQLAIGNGVAKYQTAYPENEMFILA